MKQCPQCKRDFTPSSKHKLCPRCRYYNCKDTCPRCYKPKGRMCKVCLVCFNNQRTGENSPTWKGGRIKHHKGYLMCRLPNHPRGKSNGGYVFEHILVLEAALGRFLTDSENVHHKNGIKDDNRAENLELWVKPHPPGIRTSDAVEWAKDILKRYT